MRTCALPGLKSLERGRFRASGRLPVAPRQCRERPEELVRLSALEALLQPQRRQDVPDRLARLRWERGEARDQTLELVLPA